MPDQQAGMALIGQHVIDFPDRSLTSRKRQRRERQHEDSDRSFDGVVVKLHYYFQVWARVDSLSIGVFVLTTG